VPRQYLRLGTFALDDVLPHVGQKARLYAGQLVRMGSLRLQVFARKGTTCVTCGRAGTYFALERQAGSLQKRWSLHLYADDGVILTRDHIVPSASGGANTLRNLQPMCWPCNQEKSKLVTVRPSDTS